MMTSLVAFFCSEFLSRDGGRRVSAQWVIVEEGFCVPRELSTYLTHVGDDGAKISKRYVRMCRCCGDVWDCSQSLDFWASPAATRGCCSCPTHVNCVCNVTRWNKGKKQGRKERNRPKFSHKTAPTPISNAPEAFRLLRYPQYHRNGERYRELLRSHRLRREVEAAIRIFFLADVVHGVCLPVRFLTHGTWHLQTSNAKSNICGRFSPEVEKEGYLSLTHIGKSDPFHPAERIEPDRESRP